MKLEGSPPIVYVAVWDVDGELNIQAYAKRESAERDFPASDQLEYERLQILHSTVQP